MGDGMEKIVKEMKKLDPLFYRVVPAQNIYDLMILVNNLCLDGWEPIGGVLMVRIEHWLKPFTELWLQAMRRK